MATTVTQVSPRRVADVDTYWPQIVGLYLPEWRCSANAEVTLPDKEWVKRSIVSGTLGVAVGLEAGAAHGVVVWRPELPARILWLYANPARWGEAATALVRAASTGATQATAPWGCVEQDRPRDAFLATGNFELWDGRPQYPAGTVIRLVI